MTTAGSNAANLNPRSKECRDRAARVLARGYKSHRSRNDSVAIGGPGFAVRSRGARFWDVDGREYIDWVMGYGPVVLGHADAEFSAAIQSRITRGTVTSVEDVSELELAEVLIDIVPSAEMVALFVGGSAACFGALRMARAHTGRPMVVKCGYHGWLDWCRPGDTGVPEVVSGLTVDVQHNDVNAIKAAFATHGNHIAAVMIESVMEDGPAPGYFDAVGEIAHHHGAVFVLDEVKTGFRYALGGTQQHYGIEPDLTVFGKAMSNGYPGSAVVGRRDIMSGVEPFMGATFHGDGLSVAAALETIRRLERDDVIAHLWRIGGRLKDGLNGVLASSRGRLRIAGDPPLLRVAPTNPEDPLPAEFCALMHLEGIYIVRGGNFASLAHTDSDVEQTVVAARRVMEQLAL